MFLFVGNYTGLLWALCCVLLAKIRCSQLYSTKIMFCFICRQFGHFPAICSCKWISFLIFNEWLWFLLDGTQNNVLACFLAKLRCFKHYLSKNNLHHFFLHEIRVWRSNLSKKFLCSEFELVWALCHKSARFSFSVFKISYFKLYCSKNMF